MSVQQYRAALERQRGQQARVQKDLRAARSAKQTKRSSLNRHEEAREIIREVGIKTQQQLQYRISEITSLALEAVFDDPYELVVEFVQRRNKTECDLYFSRDGNRVEPMEASGFGAVNIAAFALRAASWSMQRPRSRNVLILDEPLKELKGEESNRRALDMIKEISRELEMQIIMVSDERVSREATIEATDRLFETTLHKKATKIKD